MVTLCKLALGAFGLFHWSLQLSLRNGANAAEACLGNCQALCVGALRKDFGNRLHTHKETVRIRVQHPG